MISKGDLIMSKALRIVFSVIIIVILAVSALAFAACGNKKTPTDIVVAMPDGAPALALAQLMDQTGAIGSYNLSYSIKDGTAIRSAVMSGEADIALLPMNIAAALYNGGIDVRLVSVNIFGLLYLVGSESYDDGLNSLIGKVVYNVGQGGTPDYTFKKILSSNGIAYEESDTAVDGKVALAYMTPSVLVPQLKTGIIKYAVLGEPQVTLAITGSSNTVLADLQEEWKTVTGSEAAGYPQVGLVVKASLLESDPAFVQTFLQLVRDNADWVLANPADAGQIIRDNEGTMPVTLTSAIVEKCNIRFLTAEDAKADVVSYLTVLRDFNAQSVGGKLPDDGFYHTFE